MGSAVLIKRELKGSSTHLLTFITESEDGESMGFLGGQYIIINSQIPLASNPEKTHKRAYSIFSNDENQNEFQLVFKEIQGGVVSNSFLKDFKEGETLQYSGPWGKFLKDEDYWVEGKSLVMASDTGIVSALSFVNSQKNKERLKDLHLIWFVPGEDYFLSYEEIKSRIPSDLGSFEIVEVDEFQSNNRVAFYEKSMDFASSFEGAENAFLAGDGKMVRDIKSLLVSKGMKENRVGTEIYFNK